VRLPSALFALVLAACAGAPQWNKDGAAPERVAADLEACRESAPYEPRRNIPAPSSKPASNLLDFKTLSEREGERFMKDERHVSECMRAKGYKGSNS
jgi:hypothetical protein